MKLGKFSFGIGDRFGHQGFAQLTAIQNAKNAGLNVIPVWNKSHREHEIVGTSPEDVRREADRAVEDLGWKDAYHVDADHINMGNVDPYINASDFFTIDVADYIGKPAGIAEKKEFLEKHRKYLGELRIPGISDPYVITEQRLGEIADTYLHATGMAAKIYGHISRRKGKANLIPEVSMDEVSNPQSPAELFFILSELARRQVNLQTIAPKFSGRFNKGVDYEGDLRQFEKEFEEDLLVIDFAVREFNLPQNLKLSVHSGSDKFSIYPVMGRLIKKHDKGIHLKTAGTTWLEEVIGLAQAGSKGLEIAKNIYSKAYEMRETLCAPYATVIDIDPARLPSPGQVDNWESIQFTRALRHIPENPDYNPHFRQLIHVAYKVAAGMGKDYYMALKEFAPFISRNVEENIYERHLKRLFEL